MSNLNKETPDQSDFKALLKEHRLKATPQRLAVHSAMMKMGHACADMICTYIKDHSLANISQASVYNILSQLSEHGIYARRFSSDNRMFFDVNSFKHIHLYDSRNNEFIDVMDEEVTNYLDAHFKKKKFKGYKVDAIDLQLVCHPTRKKI